uniref:Uncharacterized protein n=1 Tax=Chromera velia CCMP2878 TaxID=1169474 RepID=A0A0G4HMH6_9ALVE|eukprot:Cvel_7544.t1-p1 / transcript=Cvel_7544.t1 / gene=Cvel_7544 / organism=Chromera_velia_CCMP2878 / gene_product=hypothetical protein / transcript_product=hypothetical protein / location=Cvel_scaffold396:75536-76759(-) / protein_length=356 / sequence_SO=supercontig / SO=protein_coding / is_pseudo=false
MKFIVAHEFLASISCVGDLFTGNFKRARERWVVDYAENSVLGSFIKFLECKARGETERAELFKKGCLRACGSMLVGGGICANLPVFAELKTCGDSLGDCMAEGGRAAQEEWGKYMQLSLIGAGVGSAIAASRNDIPEARRLGWASGAAALRGVVEAGAVVAVVVVPGVTAAAGKLVAVSTSAAAGGVGGASSSAVSQVTQPDFAGRVDVGEVIGSALLGAGIGAAAGAVAAARAASAASDTPTGSNTPPPSGGKVAAPSTPAAVARPVASAPTPPAGSTPAPGPLGGPSSLTAPHSVVVRFSVPSVANFKAIVTGASVTLYESLPKAFIHSFLKHYRSLHDRHGGRGDDAADEAAI